MESLERHYALTRLVGGLAHDFNNLLTVILGIADDLRASGFGTPQQREDLALLQQAGESASAITRQLLAFSRRRTTEPATFVLDAAIGSLQRLLGRMLGDNFVLETQLQASQGYVYIDPSALDEVLITLVDVAQGSLPSGGRLVIGTSRVEDAELGSALVISVSSAAVTSDDRERIVQALRIGSGDAGEEAGLARLRRLVAQAGGRITAGDGSSLVVVHLPEHRVEHTATGAEDQPATSGQRVVLVVEDDPNLCALIGAVLRRAGCAVSTARTVDEAIEVARGLARVDVLFADLVLPGRDGTALASELRARFPQAQIVYTSGYAQLPRLTDPESLADSRFLRKPYTASQLREMVAGLAQ